MKAKRIFLIINCVLTFLFALLCFVYVGMSIFMMHTFANAMTKLVLAIANGWFNLDVVREEVVDGVMLFMIALSFIILCIAVLKLMFAIKQIKYCRMDYTEFFTHRHKYVGLILGHTFTLSFYMEWIILIISLCIKTREEKELEKDLKSGSVSDVKTQVFGKTGIGNSADNLLLNSGTKVDTSFYDFKQEEKTRNNAMELWRSGAISEKEYQKILKKLDKERK